MAFQAEVVHSHHSIDYTPSGTLAAGDVVVQGELVGVMREAGSSGVLSSLLVNGVCKFAKSTGGSTAITAGALVYWDDTNNVATASSASGANKRIGYCTKAAVDGDAVVECFLTP